MTHTPAPKACVIGWPIKHSRSPLIHGYWLKQHAMAGSYEKREISPDKLQDFIASLRRGEYVGCNVTIPHKENVASWVDDIDPAAAKAGSLNTIYWENARLKATSTDGLGFIQSLMAEHPLHQINASPTLILGAGGSARAIANSLAQQGSAEILVHNRTPSRAITLANTLGPPVRSITTDDLPHVLPAVGLIINTTSAGLTDNAQISLPWQLLNTQTIIADIVYTPLITPLLQQARNHGHPILPGLGMLLHQAVFGFEKWFGVKPKVTPELHDIIAKDIDPDYRRC